MEGLLKRSNFHKACLASALVLILLFLMIRNRNGFYNNSGQQVQQFSMHTTATISSRKLLSQALGKTNQIGDSCSKDDIVVYQGATTPLPNGIPTYTVQILNVCVTGHKISGIHVKCGWFSSARMINPKIFRRLGFDDCLVNDGAPLLPGGSVSFQYANTFRYPLSVSSVTCT